MTHDVQAVVGPGIGDRLREVSNLLPPPHDARTTSMETAAPLRAI